MSEMVEQSARKAFERMSLFLGPPMAWEQQQEPIREMWRTIQREAIEAMREPTEAMLSAAIGTNTAIRSPMWRDGWRAMIDAALAESDAP
jgi:hypothetical protein